MYVIVLLLWEPAAQPCALDRSSYSRPVQKKSTAEVHVIRKRQFLAPNSAGLGRITVGFGIGGAVGLLLSSATLYATYRPYPEIFQRYLRTGDESQLPLLSSFLGHTGVLLGFEGFHGDVRVYFWFAVSALCVLALLLAVILLVARHLWPQVTI